MDDIQTLIICSYKFDNKPYMPKKIVEIILFYMNHRNIKYNFFDFVGKENK